MGYTRPRGPKNSPRPLSGRRASQMAAFDPNVDRRQKHRWGERAAGCGSQRREDPIGHWDQTKPAFRFLQENVDYVLLYANLTQPTSRKTQQYQ